MSAIAVVATLNGIVVNLIMASRVMYGLSRQRGLPAWIGAINATTQTPIRATLVATGIVLFFSLLLPIADLADLSARITLCLFAIVNLSLVRLKLRKGAESHVGFKCPVWVPAAGFASCILFIVADIVLSSAG
jgi:basic amino acid/polyamine antiporter, APA family